MFARDIKEESLKKHYEWKGNIEVVSRARFDTREKRPLVYTPGAAQPGLEISVC